MLCLFAHVEGSATEQVAVYHRAGDAGFHRNMAVAVDASFTMPVLLRCRPARPALDTVGTKAEETGDCRKGNRIHCCSGFDALTSRLFKTSVATS